MKTKVCVFGCTGRVGKRLCSLAESHSDLELVAAIARDGHQAVGLPLHLVEPSISKDCHLTVSTLEELKSMTVKPDFIVDFSTPNGTMACLAHATELGIPVVIGTTGLTSEQSKMVENAGSKIPIIHAMNFSLGVNLLVQVAATVASALGEDFDIEIVESHHNKKVDSPSGTALALADSICQSLGRSRADLVHGRQGQVGERSPREIGMHAVRMGSVIGDHTVHFGSSFERIELTHRAQNRDVFASGALKAGIWLAIRSPGMYTMADVLFKANNTTRQ